MYTKYLLLFGYLWDMRCRRSRQYYIYLATRVMRHGHGVSHQADDAHIDASQKIFSFRMNIWLAVFAYNKQ